MGTVLHQEPRADVAVVTYPSPSWRRVTAHTLSLVRPAIEPGWSVIDIGCGTGFVAAELSAERPVMGVDIVDDRKTPGVPFRPWDGRRLPIADGAYDVALFAFVLHHVPDELKASVITEARRVARKRILILEDTPRTPIDWLAAWLHGLRHRHQIGSNASFGFKSRPAWERWLGGQGLRVLRSDRLPRFARDWYRPWARSWFVAA